MSNVQCLTNPVYRAEAERLAAERLLEEAKSLIEDAKIRVDKDVTEVDVKLHLRVGDVEFWKGELDNKLAQLKDEIDEVGEGAGHGDRELKAAVTIWVTFLYSIWVDPTSPSVP